MIMFIRKRKFRVCIRILTLSILLPFFGMSIMPVAYAQSVANLSAPGIMVAPSVSYSPTIVMGITIYPENPLQFDFIIDVGDDNLQGEELRTESKKLINYFLATLTVPEDEMWVNLSPYEKDRIVADGLGVTEMGRDMLAQDYLLKQLTASLMYPEKSVGSEFWKRVYAKTQAKFGTTKVPTNTFNKIWIVPDRAVVYVSDNNIFVSESHLKIMLEEDYLALESNVESTKHGLGDMTKNDVEQISEQAKEAIREVLIPEIEREVNEGKNFANLRQIFNSMILAAWYKKNLKESVLGKVYVNSNKTNGIELENKNVKEEIYNQYVEAFKKGVYNYIKEDFDESTQQIIPRKYFSGGENFTKINVEEPRGEDASSPVKERFTDEGAEYKIGVKLGMTDVFDEVVHVKSSSQIPDNRPATDNIDINKWKEREYLAQAGLMPPDGMGLELAYNPAIQKISDDFYLIVYRGVKKDAINEDGLRSDNTTNFYAAISYDGIHVDQWISDPIMVTGTNENELNSIEDPRLVLGIIRKGKFFPDLNGDTVAMFYAGFNINKMHRQIEMGGETAEDKGRVIPLWSTISVKSLKEKNFNVWERQRPIDISIMVDGKEIKDVTDNKDMTIFPEPVFIEAEENGKKVRKRVIVVIDRPMNDRRHMDIRISWRDAEKGFDGPWNPDGEKILLRSEPGTWKETLGGGGTPVKTDYGWAFPYHGTEYIDNGFDYVIQTLEQELNNLEGNSDLSDLYHLTETKLNEIKERKLNWENEVNEVKGEIGRLKSEGKSFQKEEEDLAKLLNEAKLRIYRTGELLLDPTNISRIIEDNGPSITPHTVYELAMFDGFLLHTFNDGDVLLDSGELASWRGSGDHTMDVLTGKIEDLFSREALAEGGRLALEADTVTQGGSAVLGAAPITADYGGIDFNPNNLNLSEQGQASDINFTNFPDIQPDRVNGIIPVIINITPIINFPLLLGGYEAGESQEISYLNRN